MASTQFLWVGDLHIDGLDLYFPDKDDPNDAIFDCLEQAMDHAKREGVKYIILPGDIFDSPYPKHASLVRLMMFFYKHKDLTFIIYFGNHDYETQENISISLLSFIKELGTLDNVRVFMKPTFFKLDGVPFQVLPWPHSKRIEDRPPSVILAHVTATNIKASSGYTIKSKVVIEPEQDLWLIGDVHERIRYHKRIIYPGLMYQTNFGEKENKGFSTFNVSTSKSRGIKFTYKFHPVKPPFILRNIIIKDINDLDQVSADPKYRYKLFIKDDFQLPFDFLTLHPNVVLHSKYKNKQQLALSTDPQALEDFVEGSKDKVKDRRALALQGLTAFLKAKGWDKIKIKKAKRIVSEIIEGGF